MKRFISVVILLAVQLTNYCYSNEVEDFWNSLMNNFNINNAKEKSDVYETINQYWLYTRDNPLEGQQLFMNDSERILSSNMKTTKDTIFLIHGWLGYYDDDFNKNATAALLYDKDVNVICVDWSAYSIALYSTSLNSVPKVGTDVGDFIIWLVTIGYSYDKIHIVGHSLGAHAAGKAGRKVNGLIKRITGLDPAGPVWDQSKMLSKNDAKYVECIHTSAMVGTSKLCGHADFFPNGGSLMSGCGINLGCSHLRAFYYFSATVVFPDKFVGAKCKSVEDAKDCNCYGEPALMGNNDLHKDISGIYCLETTENYPYF